MGAGAAPAGAGVAAPTAAGVAASASPMTGSASRASVRSTAVLGALPIVGPPSERFPLLSEKPTARRAPQPHQKAAAMTTYSATRATPSSQLDRPSKMMNATATT